ncbi:hypothetical protein JHL17_12410 [Azospirillum sp. YIM B02556]|uniref:Uncharacterized protein n=1 Tax=Azospirillum endophyticum TaxID=2800326 RepID=A0ABS1F468_9PROT|nr:hypothetical protein [Azospirillum endophyticum]MBK1838218.1 hypothetical protein [Azospirillum endophyticum]
MSELADDLDHWTGSKAAPGAGLRTGPRTDGVRMAVRTAMAGAGFTPMDLGDGCRAWYRRSDDGTHALISHNNALDGDPAVKDWIVGQYGERGGFVEVGGLPLSRALEGADVLPSPVRPDGSLVEALYPSLQQALDDLG